MTETFEIRTPDGAVKLTSSLPSGDYSKELLKQIEENGYHIFVNGKRKKSACKI